MRWLRRSPARAVVAAITVLAAALLVVLLVHRGGTGRRTPKLPPATALAVAQLGTLRTPMAAPGPLAAPLPPGAPVIGASTNRVFNDRLYGPAQIAEQLHALRASGATDARSDALWEAAEPTPPAAGVHHFEWAYDDLIMGSLSAQGLRWFPIIDYSASWAQSLPGVDHSAPVSAAAYAAYVGAFIARYGRGGQYWRVHPDLTPRPVQAVELWNEPDGGIFWLPRPDPAGYGNLYAAGRNAAKAADPSVRVIVGGLTNPIRFVPELVAARPDLRGHIDGIAIHPYAPNTPSIIDQVRKDRAALRGVRLGEVPLYVTEFGWTTKPTGSEDWLPAWLRPGRITDTVDALAHTDCLVGGIFLYTWVTPERDAGDHEQWFGVHPPGGGTSPAERGFAAGVQAARMPGPEQPVCGGKLSPPARRARHQ